MEVNENLHDEVYICMILLFNFQEALNKTIVTLVCIADKCIVRVVLLAKTVLPKS